MARIVLGNPIIASPRASDLCGRRFIDIDEVPVNATLMDADDISAKRPDDLLAQLARQDLDPFSVEELQARISALEAEISRSAKKLEAAVNHRSTADALFKR